MRVKNNAAFPRAWPVHFARIREPGAPLRLNDLPDDDRLILMRSLLYQGDAIWSDPNLPVHDLHAMAFVGADDPASLSGFIVRAPVEPTESVTITKYEPRRAELTAVMNRPG